VTLLASKLIGSSPRAVERLLDTIAALGGRPVEIGPDTLMAVFGVEPSEDAPVRAIQAALAVRRAADRTRQDGQQLVVRTAVHLADVLVGEGERRREVAIDAEHPARAVLDRLLLESDGDAILGSPETMPYLERHFVLDHLASGVRVIRRDPRVLQ
jgi:class 3 adenylate cyclase